MNGASDEERAVGCAQKRHPYRLGRRFSLGGNRHFQRVYRRGKSYTCAQLSMVYLRARYTKVGFSVSSKMGGSVVRNRIRRRMTEDFRLLRPSLKPGQYVFVARQAAKDATADQMARAMRYLLRRADLFANDVGPKAP